MPRLDKLSRTKSWKTYFPKKSKIIFVKQIEDAIFAIPKRMNFIKFLRQGNQREISSAGSEHLVYTEGVGGSNPSFPTKSLSLQNERLFYAQLVIYIQEPKNELV